MQFKIPQDVQREDKIVGPLSMRQLIICTVGFGLAYAVYTALGREFVWITALIPTVIIGLITVAFAFVKPLDLNFEKFVLFWLAFAIILPKKRYWLKGTGDPLRSEYIPMAKKEKKLNENDIVLTSEDKRKKLLEISKNIK